MGPGAGRLGEVPMREHFAADWAFGITGAIENVVRGNFPHHLRNWPLLNSFRLEPYELPDQHMVLVLKDQLSGVPVIDGASPFPHSDHPTLPPKAEEIELWQFYLREKLGLRPEDASLLIPIKDSGKGGAPADYDLFSAEEQLFWAQQLLYVVTRYKAYLEAHKGPEPQPNVTNHFYGSNSRMNLHSHDSSVNVVGAGTGEIFDLLRARLVAIEDEDKRAKVAEAIDEMEATQGSGSFVGKYKEFVSLTADHMAVFQQFIPALTNLLG